MFVEPEANETKATVKADPSAPARSAIRRQRTVRYTPHVRDRPTSRAHTDAMAREIHQRRLLREYMRHRGLERRQEQDREQERLMREAERGSARAEAERAEASRQQRFVSGRAILRDALSYERPSERMRMLRDYDEMPDLVPIDDLGRSSSSEIVPRPFDTNTQAQTNGNTESRSRSPPPRYMPTPPYSFGESSNSSSPTDINPPLNGTNPINRARPSARLPNETMDEYISRVGQRPSHQAMLDEITRTRLEVERTREEVRRTREEAHRRNWRSFDSIMPIHDVGVLPPHRRTDRRNGILPPLTDSEAPRGQVTVDGLGDRRRSFSPDDDAWDTLLTTITPDERIPSVHSSFTSASASASASNAPNPPTSTSYSSSARVDPTLSSDPMDLYLCENFEDTDSEDSLTEEEISARPSSSYYAMDHPYLPRPRAMPSRRYDPVFSDRAERLARYRRLADADIGRGLTSSTRYPRMSEHNTGADPTYEDEDRRNGLRQLMLTETGIERSSGARPARERL